MKRLFFLILLFVNVDAMAQKRDYYAEFKHIQDSINKNFPKNTIYLELLGAGGLYSINYDRIFYQHKRLKLSYRIGLTSFLQYYTDTSTGVPIENTKLIAFVVPLGLNLIHGRKNRFIEFGATYTIAHGAIENTTTSSKRTTVIGEKGLKQFLSLILSYRRQSKKGLFFKIGGAIFKDIAPTSGTQRVGLGGVKGLPGWFWWSGGISIGKSF